MTATGDAAAFDPSGNDFKRWLKRQWCGTPKADAEFVSAMEELADVYHRLHDLDRPTVCLDEASRQGGGPAGVSEQNDLRSVACHRR